MEQERWNKMTVSEQILNIGGEVQRAVDRKERHDEHNTQIYLNKALDWLALSKNDPKNERRISELDAAEEELRDYFEDNNWGNDANSIMGYWNSFLSAIW